MVAGIEAKAKAAVVMECQDEDVVAVSMVSVHEEGVGLGLPFFT